MLVWVLLAGCRHKDTEPVPVPEPVASAPATSAPDALLRALSVRDAEPSCSAIDALSPDPVVALTTLADTVTMPPVAPMRAVRCLVQLHAAEAEPALSRWIADPTAEGYARLIADELASAPTDVAVRVATAGLAGPHAALIREKVRLAATPELRALVP